ncbi:hypothetical protein CEP88_14120 [Roseobacter denitrificans]|nr:hypothetical protein CEP88_14120 [Roseobacter denitrificans]
MERTSSSRVPQDSRPARRLHISPYSRTTSRGSIAWRLGGNDRFGRAWLQGCNTWNIFRRARPNDCWSHWTKIHSHAWRCLMQKPRFTRFDLIAIDDQEYRFHSQNHDSVLFERLDVSGAIESFSYDQILTLKSSRSWSYQRDYFRNPNTSSEAGRTLSRLASLKTSVLAKVTFRENYCQVVRELHSAGVLKLREDSLEPNRPMIQIEVNERETARQTIGKKLRGGDELPNRKLPCSRTILEHYREWRDAGYSIEALIPKTSTGKVDRKYIDIEKEEFLRKCVAHHASAGKRLPMARTIEHTFEKFDEENERRESLGLRPLGTVSRSTIVRRIQAMDPFYVTFQREGAEAARRQFSSSSGGLQTLAPMERIEIDDWYCDVRSLLADLSMTTAIPANLLEQIPKGNRWVCCAIDTATRCILGLRIAKAPSAAEALRLLSMVVSDKSDIARQLGCEKNWPQHGGICDIATDSHSGFQSDVFRAAISTLHGTKLTLPLGKSELRSSIERVFGSMVTGVIPFLPGRTGSNPQDRGDYDSDKHAVLDDNDLLYILIHWVVDHYHYAPHRGLGGDCPAGRWEKLTKERFVPECPDAFEKRTALGVPLERTLQKRGLEICGNFYRSDETVCHFKETLSPTLNIRLDPDDIGAVSVEINNRWFEARCEHGDLDGVSLEEWKAEHELILQRYKDVELLNRKTRRSAIAAIKARCDQAIAKRLIPGSTTDNTAGIDAVQNQLFHGRSYEPLPETVSFNGAGGPFGTPISPDPSTVPAAEQTTELTIEDESKTSEDDAIDWPDGPSSSGWNLEDE